MKASAINTVIFVVIGAFIIIAISILNYLPTETKLKETTGFHLAALQSIQSINSQMIEAVEESFAYAVSGDVNEKEEFLRWAENFKQNAKIFYEIAKLDRPEEEDERILYENVISRQSDLVKHAKTMFVEYEETGIVSRETFQKYEAAIDSIFYVLKKFVKIEAIEVENEQKIYLATINRFEKTIYAVAVFSFMLVVGLGLFFFQNQKHIKIPLGLNIKQKIMFGSTLALILVIVLSLVAYRSIGSLVETADWVKHTHQVISNASTIEKLIVDMETGQRGFLITGKQEFLEPYETGKIQLFILLTETIELVSD